MKLKLWTLAALTALSLTAAAESQSVMSGTTGWFNQSDVLRQAFPTPTFVDKMVLKAEGGANFTMAQVYADGEWVANLGVPGRDPEYPVVIRKRVTNITIQFNGSVHICENLIYGAPEHHHRLDEMDGSASSSDSVQELADKASITVNYLQENLSDEDFNTYLKPIRKAALRLSASAGGRSATSDYTRNKAINLIAAIKAADGLEDKLIEREKFSDAVRNLETIKDALEHKYEIDVRVVGK